MKMRMNTMASFSCLAAAAVFTRRSVSSFVVLPRRVSTTTTTTTAFAATRSSSSNSSSNSSRRISQQAISTTTRLFSTASIDKKEDDVETETQKDLIPVTLLSGFLGSGKTSTLQHLLENTDGLRIGVVVNDMASVNIDAKLVKNSDSLSSSSSSDSNGVVELQNGCACCSLADELLTTIEDLVDSRTSTNGNGKSEPFDAIVVELSGVADPIAIKQNWKNAQITNQSVTTKADMKRIVTLIDSSTFGTDWMTWDDVGERGWVDPESDDGCTSQRKVPELLAEQVEAADVLLLNKIDLAGPKQVQIAKELAKQINENAIIEEVEFGKVTSPKQIIRDDIITTIIKEEKEKSACSEPGCDDQSHSHSHSHSSHEEEESSSCKDSDCGDPDCDEHGTVAVATASCADTDCTDESHDHSHSAHSHSHSTSTESDCNDPDCTDASHDHGTATASAESDCTDTDCTDESHDHSHSAHSHSHSTSTDNLGIVNFVYRSDRPFETRNLMSLLNTWPVPIKENLEDLLQYEEDGSGEQSEAAQAEAGNDTRESPFSGVLRSKGFCWLAPTKWSADKDGINKSRGDQWRHDTAMYWSHAGRHFGISTAGKWWATLPQPQIKEYFKDDPTEYERIMAEDFQKDSTWGDRRQEIVFIGININEEEITKSLDNCLVGDKGMERYSQQLNNYMNTILSTPVTSSSNKEGGLFDIANTDHIG